MKGGFAYGVIPSAARDRPACGLPRCTCTCCRAEPPALRRGDQRPDPPCLAAPGRYDSGVYTEIQYHSPRVLRVLQRSGRRNPTGKTDQELVPGEETRARGEHEPVVDRLRRALVPQRSAGRSLATLGMTMRGRSRRAAGLTPAAR